MSITENNLLVVDEDASFIDEAKRLFDGRLPTVRSITEAVALRRTDPWTVAEQLVGALYTRTR